MPEVTIHRGPIWNSDNCGHFSRRPGRLLNVLCTFNLRPVSIGLVFNFRIKYFKFTKT